MSDEAEILKKRFVELAKKSHGSGIFLFSDFLGLAEQALFDSIKREIVGIKYDLFGGAEGAERVMVRFGDKEELFYELPFPIVTLRISPVSEKFAEKLTHRDYLGAILNLGIERSVVGDIVVRESSAYVFVREDIAPYIQSELVRVRHTDVRVSACESLPEGELYRTESRRVQIQSERLDAVIARVFNLSREDAQSLFSKRLVFASGREIGSVSYSPKLGEVVSVRGHGRFIYRGFESNTRRGKLNVLVDLFV